MYKLIIEDDEGHTTVVPLVKDEITIGRKEGNTIRLTERNVSRHHARLIKNNGSVFIEDLDSYNGVKVNGDKITARTTIREGDLVEIGDYHFALQWVGEEMRQTPPSQPGGVIPVTTPDGASVAPAATPRPPVTTSPGTPPVTPAAQPASQSDGATAVLKVPVEEKKEEVGRVREIPDQQAGQLAVTTTELSGQQFKLNRTEMILGRTQDCEICLPHRSVSSRHAKIVYDGGIYRILDLDSANGVLVNGEEYSRVDLRRGDTIELGHVRIRYMAPGDVYQPEPDLAMRDDGRTLVDAAAAEEDQIRAPGSGKKFGLIALVVLVLGAGGYAAYHFASSGGTDSVPDETGPSATGAPPAPREDPAAADFRDGVEKLENRFLDAAEAAFMAAREKNPDYPGLDSMIEKVQTEKQHAKAFENLQKAIMEKNHDEAWHLINEIPEDSLYAKDVVDIKPEVRKNYIAMHLRKAEKYKEAGVFDKAVKHVDEVLIEKPDDPVALKLKRQILRMQKARAKPPEDRVAVKPETGRKVRKDGHRKKRKQAKDLIEQGKALERKRSYAEAIASYRKALGLQPSNCEAHLRLGAVYAKTGDANRGAQHYRRFVDLCPKHMMAPRVRMILKQFETYKKSY